MLAYQPIFWCAKKRQQLTWTDSPPFTRLSWCSGEMISKTCPKDPSDQLSFVANWANHVSYPIVFVCVVTESALFSLVERTGKRKTTTFGGSKTVLTQLRTPESAAWWNTPNFGCFYDYIGTRDLAGITESGPFTPRCPQPWPHFRKYSLLGGPLAPVRVSK